MRPRTFLALALALLACAGLAAAVASVAGPTLRLPARAPGDRALYAGDGGSLLVEALPRAWARGADGPAWAEGLQETRLLPDGTAAERRLTWLADGAVVAQRTGGAVERYSTWTNRYGDVGVASGGPSGSHVEVERSLTRFAGNATCGLATPFQGAAARLGGGFAFGACPRMAYAGLAELDGRRVARFAADGHEVDLDPGLPYPVRILTPAGEWRLTGFQPGTPAPAGPTEPRPADAPPLALAPTTRTGPAPAPHPFPIDAALAAARALRPTGPDPSGERLDAFLAAHPDWFVSAASYFEQSDSEWVLRTWDLVLEGPGDRLAVAVTQEAPEHGATPTFPFWSTSSPQRGGLQVGYATPDGPGPAAPAERLPTVASLWAAWEATRPADAQGPANGWSFAARCPDAACRDPAWEVGAGRVRFATTKDPLVEVDGGLLPASQVVEARSDVLLASGDGALLGFDEVRQRATRSTPGLLPTPAPQAGATLPRPPALPAPVLVGVAAATAAGGLALLLAALFSRIASDDLLRHPVRARLHQLIEAEPGLHFQELGRRAGVARGALQHHLDKLEAAGLVTARRAGGYRCYFLGGAVPDASAAQAGATRSEGAQRVLEALRAGIAGPRAIAAHTGLSVGTVAHHLKRLREAGLAPQAL